MRYLVLVLGVVISCGAYAETQISDETLREALDNPRRYYFDDGGTIDFGHGFFLRRIHFSGIPNVCHIDGFLYGGTRKKCVFRIRRKAPCTRKEKFELIAKMSGEKIVCNKYGRHIDNSKRYMGCRRYDKVPFDLGPLVKVDVYKKGGYGGDTNDGYMGYTYIEIPECDTP